MPTPTGQPAAPPAVASLGEAPAVVDWGRLAYPEALERQRDWNLAVSRDEHPPVIVLLEHPPVITVPNRPAAPAHVLASAYQLRRLGVQVVPTDRGGDVTLHAPGQLVAYPFVRLDQLGIHLTGYMRRLEHAVIETTAAFGVATHREAGATGVWASRHTRSLMRDLRWAERAGDAPSSAKLCAMGVRVRKHTTMHGLALNVSNDLSLFSLIDPCGLGHRPVASLASLREDRGADAPRMHEVKQVLGARLRHWLTPGVAPEAAA